jgi:hypothetical protein
MIPAFMALLLAGCVTGAVHRAGPGEIEHGGDDPGLEPPLLASSAPPLDHGQLHRYSTRSLPGGLTCLIRLKRQGIPHVHLKRLRGVDTPVRITGPIGGITYRSTGRRTLAGDCRLALALHRAAPYLRHLGVTELHFSSAYSYRMMPSGRPSRHAMGLAIDIHRVRVGEELLTLEEDYALGQGDSCTGDSPVLNRVACLLREKGLFDRVLTPDFDKAHYNHLHLAILSMHRRRRPPRDGRLQADAD